MPSPDFDYIITGAGCAGLSLLVHWIDAGGPGNSRVLLVDKSPKIQNDRTWCFWEKDNGLFESIVAHRWDELWFHGDKYSQLKESSPYRYKMIRGLDFYRYCFEKIRAEKQIEVLFGKVDQIQSVSKDTDGDAGAFVIVDGRKITARFIFNSILPLPSGLPVPVSPKPHPRLLQHFKGWVIRSPRAVFNTLEATLMDFRVDQGLGTAFVYVMPFSPTEALVEYTLFSEKPLEPRQYDAGLRDYIHRILEMERYTILEEEYGIIPMTSEPFSTRNPNIFHIGTAGGQTKPSTGYTFPFIQRQSRRIAEALSDQLDPRHAGADWAGSASPGRFQFYDAVLLNVLANGRAKGKTVFTDLFRKNEITDLFRFLDNESSLSVDWKVIGSLPKGPFLRAAFREIFIRRD